MINQIVAESSFGFAHGIGRSGNLLDEQPKAPGSNQLHKVTLNLLKDALVKSGFKSVKSVLVVPSATGMTLSFVLRALRLKRVLWLRCD